MSIQSEINERRERIATLRAQLAAKRDAQLAEQVEIGGQRRLAALDREEQMLMAELESLNDVDAAIALERDRGERVVTNLQETPDPIEREAASRGVDPSSDFTATVENADAVSPDTVVVVEGQDAGVAPALSPEQRIQMDQDAGDEVTGEPTPPEVKTQPSPSNRNRR